MERLYTFYPEQRSDDFVWCVHENLTDQVVEETFFEEDAQKYMEFLENGGAFAGFTPSFMLIKLNLKENLNEAFSATFSG